MSSTCYAATEEITEIKKEMESQKGGIVAGRARPTIIEPWLVKIHGKTLSTIGKIVTLQIRREENDSATYSTTANTHEEIFQIIEQSELGDFSTISVALGFPAQFSIEYSDGMNVVSNGSYATITLPGGRRGNVTLGGIQKKPKASHHNPLPAPSLIFQRNYNPQPESKPRSR